MATDDDNAFARAQACGTLWLNEAFVTKSGRFRLWKRSSIRLSIPEVVWIGIITFVSAFFLYFGAAFLGKVPVISAFVSPIIAVTLAPVIGWISGRRIARASPYRRYSGEGLSEYLWVQADKKNTIIGRLFGRSYAVNTCITYVSGKREVVPCIEWVGSARAPMMPKYDPKVSNNFMDINLIPRNEPTSWVKEARQRPAATGRQS